VDAHGFEAAAGAPPDPLHLKRPLPARPAPRAGSHSVTKWPKSSEKLRLLIAQYSIPFTDGDYELIASLRNVRNAALDGGESDGGPEPEDLERAIALLSRLIIYRLHKRDL
jgi:hypothetical protein